MLFRSGLREGLFADEILDAGADIDTGVRVADHWVAAIDGGWVFGAHPLHRVQDRRPDPRVAHVSRQHRVAARQDLTRGDSVDQVSHRLAELLLRLGVMGDAFVLATVGWTTSFPGVTDPVAFSVSYLVQRSDPMRIVAFVSHEDEQQLLAQLGVTA